MTTINVRKWFAITILIILSIGIVEATTVTLYPTDDLYLERGVVNASQETFSVIRNGTGTGAGTNGSETFTGPQTRTGITEPNFTRMRRHIYAFNTSSIGAGATVTSAKLSFVPSGVSTTLGTPALGVTGGNPSNPASIAITDYDNFYNQHFATVVPYSSLSAYNRHNFTLTNLSSINITGYSSYYLRDTWDINNSFTPAWALYTSSYVTLYGVNSTNTSARPYLEVTYTPAGCTPPVSNFTVNKISVPVGGSVHFFDNSTGTPTNWTWNFCDTSGCNAKYDEDPYFVFDHMSTWRVSLTTTNACGSNENIWYNFPNVTAGTMFYPSVDGYVQRDLTNETAEAYGDIRNNSGNDYSAAASSMSYYPQLRTGNVSDFERMRRGIMVFDTRAIGSATVTNATLSFVKYTGGSQLGTSTLGISGGYVISNTRLYNGDYQNFTDVEYSARVTNLSSVTNGERVEIPLTNLSAIESDGYTVLFLRDSWDLNSSPPAYGIYNSSYLTHYGSDNTNYELRPHLYVQYSAVAPVAHFYMNRSDDVVTPPPDDTTCGSFPVTPTLPDNTSYGAELANTTVGYYIGGGSGYYDIKTSGTHATVTDKAGLISALASATSGETVYVQGNVTIDLTGTLPIAIPAGVTLASNRGCGNSSGAIIKKTAHTTGFVGNQSMNGFSSSSWNEPMFYVMGDDVRVTGLRLYGEQAAEGAEGAGESKYLQGVFAYNKAGFEVDNNVIRGWSWAGIAAWSCPDTWVHHNYIYENHGAHEAYGFSSTGTNGNATVEYNLFNRNRHSITGDGETGEEYTARYNIFIGEGGSAGVGWSDIDVHESGAGGYAGERYVIHHNTVMSGGTTNALAVHIRHAPTTGAYLYNNWFQEASSTDWTGGYPIYQTIDGGSAIVRVTATNNKWVATTYATNTGIVGFDSG